MGTEHRTNPVPLRLWNRIVVWVRDLRKTPLPRPGFLAIPYAIDYTHSLTPILGDTYARR